jgi:hypothetical protein
MRKKILVALLIAGAVAVAASWFQPAPSVSTGVSTSSDTPPQAGQAARKDALVWQERAPLGQPRGNPFAVPATPAPAKPAAAAPSAPDAPTPPPMPYRFAGRVVRDGVSQLLLAKENDVLPVREGDTLEGGYRVESIGAEDITLLYVPLGVRQRLSASGGALGSRVAQLRWQGPERVKAGEPFTVALRVTSDEPLRVSPLEVSFDVELLEPVSVRAGKLFVEGFAYRTGSDGTIVAGPSGRARDAGHVAADAELVVFVFKPLRAAAAAELKITSLVLQGAAGKPIAAEQPGAYRAAITP